MKERSADLIDEANELAAALTESAVAEARRASQPESHPDFDGVHCVEADCGEPIPEKRLAWGKIRCVHCQAALEERQQLRNRTYANNSRSGDGWPSE